MPSLRMMTLPATILVLASVPSCNRGEKGRTTAAPVSSEVAKEVRAAGAQAPVRATMTSRNLGDIEVRDMTFCYSAQDSLMKVDGSHFDTFRSNQHIRVGVGPLIVFVPFREVRNVEVTLVNFEPRIQVYLRDGRNLKGSPYRWACYMTGQTVVAGYPAETKVSFSDIMRMTLKASGTAYVAEIVKRSAPSISLDHCEFLDEGHNIGRNEECVTELRLSLENSLLRVPLTDVNHIQTRSKATFAVAVLLRSGKTLQGSTHAEILGKTSWTGFDADVKTLFEEDGGASALVVHP